jgi:hypothetical protein
MAFQLSRVEFYDGSAIEVDSSNLMDIESYVAMHDPIPQYNIATNANGYAESRFMIVNPLVTKVTVASSDFTVRLEEQDQ